MQLKVLYFDRYTELTICADNGEPASASNPIDFVKEVPSLAFPQLQGGTLVISGMPTSVVAKIAVYYKNFVSVLVIANPRNKVAEVIVNTVVGRSHILTIPLLTEEEKQKELAMAAGVEFDEDEDAELEDN